MVLEEGRRRPQGGTSGGPSKPAIPQSQRGLHGTHVPLTALAVPKGLEISHAGNFCSPSGEAEAAEIRPHASHCISFGGAGVASRGLVCACMLRRRWTTELHPSPWFTL